MNVGGPSRDDQVNGPSMPSTGVGAAIVAMNRGTTSGSQGRQSVGNANAEVADLTRRGTYLWTSVKCRSVSASRPNRFDDRFSLICREACVPGVSLAGSRMPTSPRISERFALHIT